MAETNAVRYCQEWVLPSRAFVFEGVTVCTYRQPIGMSVCGPAVPNSSGLPARTTASGHPAASSGLLTLRTTNLPPFTAGYYLTSMTQGLSMPPGSQGRLCLGGSIGRFGGIVLGGGIAGQFQLTIGLTNLPTTPTQPALSGQTWRFQAWFRDANPTSTSNFSDAVEVTFL